MRRRHRCRRRPQEHVHGRHAVGPGEAAAARGDQVPGAGDLGRHRAEVEGRLRQDGRGAGQAGRRRPDLPHSLRRRDGPDPDLRHGRAAPRGHRRPHAARVRRQRQRRPPAGRLPRGADRSRCSVEGRHVRQTGGRGQYGVVELEVEPLERGAGFVFENKTVGGSVPKEYVGPTEAGRQGRAGERPRRRLPGRRRQGRARRRFATTPSTRRKWRSAWPASRACARRWTTADPVHARAGHEGRSAHAGAVLRRRAGRHQRAPRPGAATSRPSARCRSSERRSRWRRHSVTRRTCAR